TLTLPVSGTYTIQVNTSYDYEGEYRIRVTEVEPPAQAEEEPDDSVGKATAIVLGPGAGGSQLATLTGLVGTPSDIDFFSLGTIAFPNLQVSSVALPSGSSFQSGQPVTIPFTVQNVGSVATNISAWSDSIVLSTDAVYGNADDIPVAVIAHAGTLEPGQGYTV